MQYLAWTVTCFPEISKILKESFPLLCPPLAPLGKSSQLLLLVQAQRSPLLCANIQPLLLREQNFTQRGEIERVSQGFMPQACLRDAAWRLDWQEYWQFSHQPTFWFCQRNVTHSRSGKLLSPFLRERLSMVPLLPLKKTLTLHRYMQAPVSVPHS